ncbi:hypothetical protein FOYG_14835 [Fusarium oxysporum NRRL 32931]|uniref:Ubiquitin-like domain-containing protein n=1 Tax=Fusarium oxysporum NRRL 32931 TaxID=660029 RepID=W9HP19_FUSOX|nr:hypothetical protein FOYG_14835 [Fusarium oxysporum NRRL 32931]EWY82741.1 hypothetical protein FOYG_14835 [Fusarium oxysporum NRRL 32931]
MDSLSIIASIAGIATAGTSLSKAIYHFISSTRGASREMVEIARNISDLSCILSERRHVLQESADLCSRKLLRRINKGFQTFLWSLKRSEVQYKLTLIESHKTAIHLMLNVIILAATTRKEAQSQVTQTTSTDEVKQKEPESEVPLLRQQSENLAYAACHCLVDLSENQQFETSRPSKQLKTDSGSDNDDTRGQIQVREHGSSDGTGRWLFDLAFENYWNMSQGLEPELHFHGPVNGPEGPASDNQALVIRTPSELQIAIYEPGAGAALIETLLADWTCLSKEEITGTSIHKPGTEQVRPGSPGSTQRDVAGIRFKDAVGRKFTFPYHLVQKWEGMEELIKQAFMCVDVIGPHVLAGHYDITSPDGDIIPIQRWESTVEPGMQVGMTMWPADDTRISKVNLERMMHKVPGTRQTKKRPKNKREPTLHEFLFGPWKDAIGS